MMDCIYYLSEFLYQKKFNLYFKIYSFYKRLIDKNEIFFLKKIIKPGFVVLDLGANIGYYSSLFSNLTGHSGFVHSFEPDKTNFNNLKKVTSELKNITLNNKAVSDSDKPLKLYTSHRLNVDHRTYPVDQFSKSYQVEAISIDMYVKKKYKVNFIKMDIQGAEYPALLGMKETLLDNPDVIVLMEVCPSQLKQFGIDVETIFKFTYNLGFNIYDYNFQILSSETISYTTYTKDQYENVIIAKQIPSYLL